MTRLTLDVPTLMKESSVMDSAYARLTSKIKYVYNEVNRLLREAYNSDAARDIANQIFNTRDIANDISNTLFNYKSFLEYAAIKGGDVDQRIHDSYKVNPNRF